MFEEPLSIMELSDNLSRRAALLPRSFNKQTGSWDAHMNIQKLAKGKQQIVGMPLLKTGSFEHKEHLCWLLYDFEK